MLYESKRSNFEKLSDYVIRKGQIYAAKMAGTMAYTASNIYHRLPAKRGNRLIVLPHPLTTGWENPNPDVLITTFEDVKGIRGKIFKFAVQHPEMLKTASGIIYKILESNNETVAINRFAGKYLKRIGDRLDGIKKDKRTRSQVRSKFDSKENPRKAPSLYHISDDFLTITVKKEVIGRILQMVSAVHIPDPGLQASSPLVGFLFMLSSISFDRRTRKFKFKDTKFPSLPLSRNRNRRLEESGITAPVKTKKVARHLRRGSFYKRRKKRLKANLERLDERTQKKINKSWQKRHQTRLENLLKSPERFSKLRIKFQNELRAAGYGREEQALIMKAYDLSEVLHTREDKLRSTGEFYFIHPRAVALMNVQVLKIFGKRNANMIAAALLHDSIEDENHRLSHFLKKELGIKDKRNIDSVELLSRCFNPEIATYVNDVTVRKKHPNDKEAKTKCLKELPGKAIESQFIKLFDRLHNTMTLEWLSYGSFLKTMKATEDYIIPMFRSESVPEEWKEMAAYCHNLLAEQNLKRLILWGLLTVRHVLHEFKSPEGIQHAKSQFMDVMEIVKKNLRNRFEFSKQHFHHLAEA